MGFVSDDAEDILMKARCRLLTTNPWYGTMASLMDWDKTDEISTIGVCMKRGGRVLCLWNENFVNEIAKDNGINTIPAIMSVIKHEIEHIVRMHITRYGARDKKLSNVSADMCVNGTEARPNVDDLPLIPVFDKNGKKIANSPPIYFIEDANLSVNSSYEEVYDYLDKNQEKVFIEMNGDGLSGEGQSKPKPGQKIIKGTTVDDHDTWSKSEISEDEARQVVKGMVDQASKKAGSAPGHLQDAIKSLQEPKVNWTYILKQFAGKALGGKRMTFSRRNRRIDKFGIAGTSNHSRVPLLISVDVSGSVACDPVMLEQFFTEIEHMSHQFKITLVLWDTEVKTVQKYHRGDWRTIKATGGGGTDPCAFFEYLNNNKLNYKAIIVLTDGEFYKWPDEYPVPTLWAVATQKSSQKISPPWGQLIEIELHN
jgi:predicted metal-dependent peptidase